MPHFSGHRASFVIALAFALSGCASAFDNLSTAEFRWKNPFEAETNALGGQMRVARVVTAEDLVGPDGSCAFAAPASSEAQAQPAPPVAAAPEAPPPPPGRASSAAGASGQALYFTAGPQAPRSGSAATAAAPPEIRQGARGIGLEMSECDVVRVAGAPSNVQISANERGERTATLTYLSGDRPGIYNFVSGRLKTMDRVAEPQVAAKPRKGKQAKAKQ